MRESLWSLFLKKQQERIALVALYQRATRVIPSFKTANCSFALSLSKMSDLPEKPKSEFPTLRWIHVGEFRMNKNLLESAIAGDDISEADVTGRWRPVIGLRKAP